MFSPAEEGRLKDVVAQLLLRAATLYPMAFMKKLNSHLQAEQNPTGKNVLESIIDNILLAAERKSSMCQDSGVPAFQVTVGAGERIPKNLAEVIREAVVEATDQIPLRRNVIEPFTFNNSGDNSGWGVPFITYRMDPSLKGIKIRAELKGFGGEIKSSYDRIFTSAKSTEDSVLSFVLNSVILSKGEACLPSFVGVGVGGYGANAVENAKSEVFRELNHDEMSTPQNPEIFPVKEFEEKLLNTINRLGLGPMGVGGDTTCLGVYIARAGSHTAVVPIAINHQCWANRASEAWMDGENLQYLTRHVDPKDAAKLRTELSDGFERKTGRIHELGLPVTTKRLQDLAVGDVVYITGKICTARDGAHRRMVDLVKDQREGEIPKEIMDYGAVYHGGPIVEKTSDRWRVCAAGPTTSSRFTEDGAFLVEKGVFNISVGKGTMGARAVEAMRYRGVYLKAMGGMCSFIWQHD